MIDESEGRAPRDYDIPCVMHDPMEFDMAADQGLDIACLPSKNLNATIFHEPMEFDAASLPFFELAFRSNAVDPAPQIADLIRALDQHDHGLGGRGLCFLASWSAVLEGQVCLTLRPRELEGAVERFRIMAGILGCPLENGQVQRFAANGDRALPATIAKLLKQTKAPAPSLDAVREQLKIAHTEMRLALRGPKAA